MLEFLSFLVKSSLCITVFFMIYYLFLRKETYFTANRIFILSSLALSVMIPLVSSAIYENYVDREVSALVPTISITPALTIVSDNSIDFWQIILIFYSTILLLLLFNFIINLTKIFIIIKQFKIKSENKVNFVYYPTPNPFSFFNIVFIDKNLFKNEDFEKILTHEKVHIKYFHSIDNLIFELASIIFWFNPIIWILKSELKSVNEFTADKLAVNSTNQNEYEKLLLKMTLGGYKFSLSNNFYDSLILRRFKMLNNSKSAKIAYLKFALILPAIFIMTVYLSFGDNKPDSKADKKNKAKTEEFKSVDEMPQADLKMLQSLIKYPEEARKSGIEGTVIVNALISEDGNVLKTKVEKTDNKIFKKSAINEVKNTKFTPAKSKNKNVKTWVSIPIKFKLADKK